MHSNNPVRYKFLLYLVLEHTTNPSKKNWSPSSLTNKMVHHHKFHYKSEEICTLRRKISFRFFNPYQFTRRIKKTQRNAQNKVGLFFKEHMTDQMRILTNTIWLNHKGPHNKARMCSYQYRTKHFCIIISWQPVITPNFNIQTITHPLSSSMLINSLAAAILFQL